VGVRVDPSPPVLRLLMTAGALAFDGGRAAIDIDDVWVALMREPTAERLAAELDIDRAGGLCGDRTPGRHGRAAGSVCDRMSVRDRGQLRSCRRV
jgi:hypothetical protein